MVPALLDSYYHLLILNPVECRYLQGLNINNHVIKKEVERRLTELFNSDSPTANTQFPLFIRDDILSKVLVSVQVCESAHNGDVFYHYKLAEEKGSDGMDEEFLPVKEEGEEDQDFFKKINLPNLTLENSWENLHFESDVNQELLDYVSALLLTGSTGLDLQVFDLHKIVLLYGQPGCGKTSLCKALSQKIAIRAPKLLLRDTQVILVEVNCHSLFSKWFSESGKQIMNMFKEIRSLASQQDSFVCLLIDEIESITISRTSLFKGSEPSDSIRAVNVLLTQIDKIKELNNILILSTSNLLETVDPAFLDRVDLKIALKQPSERAKYEIVAMGIQELESKGLVMGCHVGSYSAARFEDGNKLLLLLQGELCEKSGRSLRKLPFLAFTKCLKTHSLPVPSCLYYDNLKTAAKDTTD